jgi:hypothetical protein
MSLVRLQKYLFTETYSIIFELLYTKNDAKR